MKLTGKISSILLMNLILFLVVFVLAEVTFRIVGIPYKVKYTPEENSFARFDQEIGWSYIPNKSSIQNTEHIPKPVYFDENGIRIPSPDFSFDYSKPSILFIGGSFTMGHGLSFKESFVGQFSTLKGMPYQVVNAGVQGYGSDQALLALKRYLPKFNTKVVVYTFIEDHILRNGNYDRRMLVPTARFLGTKPQFAIDSNNKLYLAKKALLYKDYFNSYLFDFIEMRSGKLQGSFPPYPVELTASIIKEMKRYCNEHGARFVVLNWRWTNNDYDRLFQDLNIDTIDTMENAPPDWQEMVLFEGIHPNARASNHADDLLFDYLRKNGLLANNGKK